MRRTCLLLPFVFALNVALAAEPTRIGPSEAAKLVADGKAVLVDVREPKEWAESGVAKPAVLLPKSDFDDSKAQWNKFLSQLGDRQVIVYCRSGRRSQSVAESLAKDGIKAANAGGFNDWKKAGLPVRRVEPTATAP